MTRLWVYVWKSSDGVRHEDSVEAPTREEAFSILRARGIKAIKVNQVFRKRDRILLLVRRFGALVIVAALVGAFSYFAGERAPERRRTSEMMPVDASIATPLPRSQIDLHGLDLQKVFAYEAERRLVAFASPGVIDSCTEPLPEDLFESLAHPIRLAEGESKRIVELKGIVAGIKRDIALFRASGRTREEISDWLRMRQQMEAQYRREVIGTRSLDGKSRSVINERLKTLGLAPLPAGVTN